jgi:hypothetical protein
VLVEARASDPDAFERSEAVLVKAASMHSVVRALPGGGALAAGGCRRGRCGYRGRA